MKDIGATGIEGCTLVGVDKSKYPVERGNCFSVNSNEGVFNIVNFNYENIKEVVKRGISWPIMMRVIGEKTAVIHDERIPDKWYQQRWCEVCCPEDLLPYPQKLTHERQEKQNVRVENEGIVIIDFSKKPKI